MRMIGFTNEAIRWSSGRALSAFGLSFRCVNALTNVFVVLDMSINEPEAEDAVDEGEKQGKGFDNHTPI